MNMQLGLPGFEMSAMCKLVDPEYDSVYRLILVFDAQKTPVCVLCERFGLDETQPQISLSFAISDFRYRWITAQKLSFQSWLHRSGRKLTHKDFRPNVVEAFRVLLDTHTKPIRILSERHTSPRRMISFQLTLVQSRSETYLEYVLFGKDIGALSGKIHKGHNPYEPEIIAILSPLLQSYYATSKRMEKEIKAALCEIRSQLQVQHGGNDHAK